MFFLTYLRRELWRRRRQAMVTATGLALGVGLVATATAMASGVKTAQGEVLHSLYGVGTDISVMTPWTATGPGGARGAVSPQPGEQDVLSSLIAGAIPTAQVTAVSRLHGVSAAAGVLTLTDSKVTIPDISSLGPTPPQFAPTLISVVGLDLNGAALGPYRAGSLRSGRSLRAADTSSDVAVVDSSYASANHLTVGSSVVLAKTSFTIVGIVEQSSASNPPDVYIPLPRAQALSQLDGYVNGIFVQTTSATAVDEVTDEITRLMPSATVTNSGSLASQVSGSLATTASLANSLGSWIAVLALVVAFTVAGLLTVAAVSRRAREFGTLKAVGWRSRRVIGQVMAESVAVGLVGAVLGIAVGFGGSALASGAAPHLSAVVATSDDTGQGGFGGGIVSGGGFFSGTVGGAVTTISNPSASHTVTIPFSAPVTGGLLVSAVALAIAGGVIAGCFGGWRIARLRPAAALARLE